MNTRLHQEAFPGEDISDRPPPEDSVPGLLALIEGDLPSGRYQAKALVRRMSALRFDLRRRLEAAAPPAVRDEVRLMVAQHGRPLVHTRFLDLADHLRARRPAGRQRVRHAARGTARPQGRRQRRRSAPLHPRPDEPRSLGGRGAARRAPRPGARAETLDAARRRHARRCSRPTSSPTACGSRRLDLPEPLLDYLDRHGAPIRYAHEPDAAPARRPPDDLRHRARQRGDAERRPPVHQARADRRCASAGSASSASRCTPASARRSAASAPTPSATRSPHHTADARQRSAAGHA